jgi:corrinoid protein of di/trimethylamine methyltransferase
MTDLNILTEAIIGGKLEVAVDCTKGAISEGVNPQDIINGYMVKGMEEIGARFEAGKAFVPNLLMSARAMKGALELIKPLLKGDNSASMGTVVIGTVKGDLHDIGKNLVASMLEGCGFNVVNLGVDVAKESFIQSAKDNDAQIICLSALLTTTMNYMKEVVSAIQEAGLKGRVKVMVGGAPLSANFASSIGADGYSANANEAVSLARKLAKVV